MVSVPHSELCVSVPKDVSGWGSEAEGDGKGGRHVFHDLGLRLAVA